MANITEKVGVEQSERPSRHRGYVTRWRLADRRKAGLLLTALAASLDSRLSTDDALAKNEMAESEMAESETPSTPFAKRQVDGVSVQPLFPQFEKGFPGFEKGFSNG